MPGLPAFEPSQFKFCSQCGQKLNGEKTKESLLQGIENERKQVTVFFSDLSGYTALSEISGSARASWRSESSDGHRRVQYQRSAGKARLREDNATGHRVYGSVHAASKA